MFKNAKVIALFTLLCRVLGYLRDFFIATYFGASVYTDMFFIAFRIPNSLRRFLGEGAVNSSVIPVISKLDEKEKPKAVWNILFWFILLLLLVAVLGVVFSKVLIALFAAGYIHNGLMDKLVKMVFPYIFFIGLTVLLMGILNSFKHFAIPAFAPSLLNLSIIASIFAFYRSFSNPVYALCVGVIIGGFLQLAISIFDFLRLKLPLNFSFKMEHSTREIFKLMGIAALGSSVMQISSMADSFVASFLSSGSFSFIFYANRLFQLPFAVFSIALAQGTLPDLSLMNDTKLSETTKTLSKFVIFYSSLVTLYFLFFSLDVVKLIFMHGRFKLDDALNVSLALKIMIASFVFFSLSKILSNAFYSQKDAKTPLKASIWASSVAIVLSFVLGFKFGFVGLAASMSISGFVNFVVLYNFFNKRFNKIPAYEFIDKITIIALSLLLLVSVALRFVKFGYLIALIFYGLVFLFGFKRYSVALSRSS